MSGEKESLRCRFERIVEKAAETGFPGAARLFEMTPREIEWELTAFSARRRLEMERLDDLAWLIGRYTAVGVNAPRKFPRKPDGVKRKAPEMSDAEMKNVFTALTGRRDA